MFAESEENPISVKLKIISGAVTDVDVDAEALVLEEAIGNYVNIEEVLRSLPALRSLVIRRGLGTAKTISFLEAVPGLTSLSLRFAAFDEVKSYAPISGLHHLKSFSCNDYVQKFDLGVLAATELREIGLVASQTKNLERLSAFKGLQAIRIHGYRAPDLQLFAAFPDLESLRIISGNVPSAEGIQKCLGMKDLALAKVGLKDPAAIGLLTGLQILELDCNKGLYDLEFLRNLRMLEVLNLLEIPRVISLGPLGDLSRLRDLRLGATPEDGDISPLVKLRPIRRFLIPRKLERALDNAEKQPGVRKQGDD